MGVSSGDISGLGSVMGGKNTPEQNRIVRLSMALDHGHAAIIDHNGNGKTTDTPKVNRHEHQIRNYKVGESNGHNHDVINIKESTMAKTFEEYFAENLSNDLIESAKTILGEKYDDKIVSEKVKLFLESNKDEKSEVVVRKKFSEECPSFISEK